jgi:hypothetical protein|tara:strand:+ start:190 stop:345 length:156 start_codon:yes stop_codon:yes gene_type:complete
MSNFLLGMLVMWFIYPMVKIGRKVMAEKFHNYTMTEIEVDETKTIGFRTGV